MKHPFKLGQEHLPFPNGGGLRAMAAKPKSQSLELEAMTAKHKLEIQKLKEKHAATNSAKIQGNKKPPRRTQGR